MNDTNLTPFARKLRRNQTIAESMLWLKLKNRQVQKVKFRRQYQLGIYIVDFISLEKNLIIELDGGQHNDRKVKHYDDKRTQWLEKNGYKVLRFWDNEVIQNINGVLETIHNAVTSPHPNPLPRERE